MQVTTTTYTIADYCRQMEAKNVVVNNEYQRSSKVWPTAARSYLIDTILSGFPIPKLSLYQKTDLRTRITIKEIVDGQQRSRAIRDFFSDTLRISGKSRFAGSKYSDLEEADQQRFLDYSLSCDVFVGATEPEIRQVFQRMNSYQVLLNKQEQRHATYQGIFKWFIVSMSEKYSQLLKDIGVFTDRQLIRMADANLFTEVLYAINNGIESASDAKLDTFYREHEETFDENKYTALLDVIFADILSFQQLHNGPLMKPYQMYSLLLALSHIKHGPVAELQNSYPLTNAPNIDYSRQIFRLSELAAALEDPAGNSSFADFIRASEKGTNSITPRLTRFKWMCAALADSNYPS